MSVLWFLFACEPAILSSDCEPVHPLPVDDPAAWTDEGSADWEPHVSEPRWVIPSAGLPVAPLRSNNNVSLLVAGDTWFLAWRTAPTHFADPDTEMVVISSTDDGQTWSLEHRVALGTDVREPALVRWKGRVVLFFFQAGTNPAAFEPQALWRSERCGPGDWTDAVIDDSADKVVWDVKIRDGRLLRTAYSGQHYREDAVLDLHLEESRDGGRSWAPVGRERVYRGGNSEAAFEIAADGTLWAVTRNEDGDETGQGSMICVAPADDWSAWDCPDVSDPERYDSPELIRHGDELYLLARRDVGGPFGDDSGLLPYSLRPKRSALYRIDRERRAVVHLMDIPGVGDTAFVHARRVGAHRFVFANYSSPVDDPDISWLVGQTSDRGTQIYLAELTFAPRPE